MPRNRWFHSINNLLGIVLTRHCMDVIASGVEICPWG